MRWFKHMTSSADDEKLSRLMDTCGLAGYGFFWRVLELIAAQVDDSGKNFAAYSKRTWCMKLAINHQTWSKMIASCEQAGLFIVSTEGLGDSKAEARRGLDDSNGRASSDQVIRVESPNILKFRDEWTERKSKTRESLGSNSLSRARVPDLDPDTEKEEEKKKNTTTQGTTGNNNHARASEGPTGGGVEDHPPCTRFDSDPGIEFQELRAEFDERIRPEGPLAGFVEYKQLRASKAWPGINVLSDAIAAWADACPTEADKAYVPGLSRFLREHTWKQKPKARASPAVMTFQEKAEAEMWARVDKTVKGGTEHGL